MFWLSLKFFLSPIYFCRRLALSPINKPLTCPAVNTSSATLAHGSELQIDGCLADRVAERRKEFDIVCIDERRRDI